MILRAVTPADMPTLFEQGRDRAAVDMAAFGAQRRHDREAFDARWARLVADPKVVTRVVEVEGAVAGYVGSFIRAGQREVCYWFGPAYWGRGIASEALAAFLPLLGEELLFARVAATNLGSLRVLAKCGFEVVSQEAMQDGDAIIQEILLRRPVDFG